MDNALTPTQAIKNAAISARIVAHRLAGKSTREAIDAVLGAGSYDAIVSDLYDALRAKGQAEAAAVSR